MATRYDHIVIGAGIVGSCTALALAKAGKNVLLLEQFTLPHTRGSSHGATRMIRSCYPEKFFARLMVDACQMWKDIEEISGTTIIVRAGVLCVAETDSPSFGQIVENMELYFPQDIIHLTIDELAEKYPMVSYSHEYSVFLDKTGGTILANKALPTVQCLFKNHGGHLRDSCKVSKIEPGDEVKVTTANGVFVAPSVVVCSGCWTRELLATHLNQPIPLQPTAVKICYWKEKELGSYTVARGFPAFIDCTSETNPIYGLPSLEYPSLVKVCVHGGVACDDPDQRDKVIADESLKIAAGEYIKEHLPGLETTPSVVEDCMYTVTPDETFVIDRLPGHKNIIVGSGFCGTGFKTAPVVGKLLAELATGQTPSHDLSPFRLSRFAGEVRGQPQ